MGTICCAWIRLEVIFLILKDFYGLVNKKQVPILKKSPCNILTKNINTLFINE